MLEPRPPEIVKDSDKMWMWNPRYYESALKTVVCYEKYPADQDEVDALMRRFFGKDAGSGIVLHDP